MNLGASQGLAYDKRLVVKVLTKADDHLAVDVSGDYAFDRFYFTGEDDEDRDEDRIDVGAGAFLAI